MLNGFDPNQDRRSFGPNMLGQYSLSAAIKVAASREIVKEARLACVIHRMLTSKCKQNESCQNCQNIGFRANLNLEKGAELPLIADLYFVYNT